MNPLTWVEISKRALRDNIYQYANIISQCALLAPVIKSNAYGHGLLPVASLLDGNTLVTWLCVVSLSEALMLRAHGIQKTILVLSIIDDELERAVSNNIDLVAYDLKTILKLDAIAQQQKKMARIHIKIDTGLSRAGIWHEEAFSFIEHIASLPAITIQGIFTHFANSESDDPTFVSLQLLRFHYLIHQLESRGIYIPYKHTTCSAAITAYNNAHYNAVRLGIGTYGLWPSAENKYITQKKYPAFELKPVLTWKTRIIQIKTVPCDSYVGYDLTYKTTQSTTIALLPVGYWDGYDRGLSNKGTVLIHNKYAPVIGRIAMNLTMVDITAIPEVQIDDEVILLGNYDKLNAHAIAQHLDTINYEIVTKINPLLPRVIVDS